MRDQVLREMSMNDLCLYARKLGIVGALFMSKEQLISHIIDLEQNPNKELEVNGLLERLPDGFGFLRSPLVDYVSGPDDIYVSPAQIRRLNLRTGDMVAGTIRKPRDGEKYFALLKITTVNGLDPVAILDRPFFEQLSPWHPEEKFNLESNLNYVSTRIIDLFAPIGKGQRGLIVAPPKTGKTVLLREIAQTIMVNHPEVYVIVLLIDERPEEVEDMRRSVRGNNGEVVSSTFDEVPERHVAARTSPPETRERMLAREHRLPEIRIDMLARKHRLLRPGSRCLRVNIDFRKSGTGCSRVNIVS